MKFYLRIYDNFHYMDESEAYNCGEYESYEDALIGAKAIVDEFLEYNLKQGVKPEELSVQFTQFGEEPVILPNEPGNHDFFSARTYMESRVKEICSKLENK